MSYSDHFLSYIPPIVHLASIHSYVHIFKQSPLKLLGIFIKFHRVPSWVQKGLWEWKIAKMVVGSTKIATMLIYGKILKIFAKNKNALVLAYSILAMRSTKFAKILVLGWPLIFLQLDNASKKAMQFNWRRRDQICFPVHLYRENVGK